MGQPQEILTSHANYVAIKRLDRLPNVTLSLELNGRSLGEVNREAMALPAFRNLPAGVHVVEQGEAQRRLSLFGSFGLRPSAYPDQSRRAQ